MGNDAVPYMDMHPQVYLSGVDLDLNGNNVNIRRWDMLLGNPAKGVEVVVWGNCNASTQRIDMFLGLPESALARWGKKWSR